MYNRSKLSLFTILTFIIALGLNYEFPREALWMLFIIPMFGIIMLYPKWLVGNLCSLAMALIRFFVEYGVFAREIPAAYFLRLIVTSIVAWVILLSVTYFSIENVTLMAKLEKFSFMDELTQAHNRRYLELHYKRLFDHATETNDPLILLVLDIDHFKLINDSFGHNAGDVVLQKLSHLIQSSIRESDVFVRMGGEEFALFLTNISLEHALKKAESIRGLIQDYCFEYKGNPIRVTISAGVSKFTTETLDELISKADQALYQAKEFGRNKVVAHVNS